ncbi:MAG: acyltransferase [Deltaproteobacteria bacterium]|nr:acyltransferase [Deltaproteobacteria bacterium]MBW2399174.1 acyltransferase [Deltaproteobacteria bacterium]MBW2667434.1 acyltransferase [Deltaproteobacteria bacterium]
MHRAPGDDYRLIHTLTGLRAYAALWVFARHFFAAKHYDVGVGTAVDLGQLIHIVVLGGWGVDVFFVISGFVMLHVYGDRFSARFGWFGAIRFYLLRLGRMYPLHLAIIVVMAIGYALRVLPWDGREPDGTGLLVNLLLVQSWGFYDIIVWNRPAWSISLEWFAYLLFPLFVMVLGPIRKWRSLLISIAVLFVVYYFARFEIGGFTRGNLGPGALMRVTFGFLLGFFLYGLYRQRFLEQVSWDTVCVVTMGLLAAMMLLNGAGYKIGFSLNFPIGLLVFATACSSGFAARIFDNRVAFYLGEISYSIYMVHFPLLRFLTHNFGDRFDAVAASGNQPLLWAIALGVFALLIAVSSFCYHVIEVPCRDWVKRRVRRNASLAA